MRGPNVAEVPRMGVALAGCECCCRPCFRRPRDQRTEKVMTLRLNIFGYEIAKLELELPELDTAKATVVDKGTKAVSRWWVKRMVK